MITSTATYKVTPPRPEQLALLATLSDQQRQIASLLAQGLTHPEVGKILHRHHQTIGNHVTEIVKKTQTRNTHDIMRLVIWSEALSYLEKQTRAGKGMR